MPIGRLIVREDSYILILVFSNGYPIYTVVRPEVRLVWYRLQDDLMQGFRHMFVLNILRHAMKGHRLSFKIFLFLR